MSFVPALGRMMSTSPRPSAKGLAILVVLVVAVSLGVAACDAAPTPTATPIPTYTPLPTNTPTPLPGPTVTPLPTASPRPIVVPSTPLPATPTPTATPRPVFSLEEVRQMAEPATVRITTRNALGTGFLQGTGFVISPDGFIMTTSDLIPLLVTEVDLIHPVVGALTGVVVGRDEFRDIAILRIEVEEDLPVLTFKDPPIVPIGETAFAVGYDGTAAAGSGASGVPGNVSFSRDYEDAQYFLVNASYSAGLSGAPVLDQNFKVLGMVSLRNETVAPGAPLGSGIFVSVASLTTNLDKLQRGSQIFYPHTPPVPGPIPPIPPFPRIFHGPAFVDGAPVAVGAPIQARVGGYVTPIIEVEFEGLYPNLPVNPPTEQGYVGMTITFYVDGFLANETFVYEISDRDPFVMMTLTADTTEAEMTAAETTAADTT